MNAHRVAACIVTAMVTCSIAACPRRSAPRQEPVRPDPSTSQTALKPPRTVRLVPAGQLPSPRYDNLVELLATHDRAFVIRGDDDGTFLTCSRHVDVLDLKTSSWSRAPDLMKRRCGWAEHAVLRDGGVLVLGGYEPVGRHWPPWATFEKLDRGLTKWTLRKLPEEHPRSAITMKDGRVLLLTHHGVNSVSAWLSDASIESWTPVTAPNACAGELHLDDAGRAYLLGLDRCSGHEHTAQTVQIFDPSTLTWSQSPVPIAAGVVVTELGRGRVLRRRWHRDIWNSAAPPAEFDVLDVNTWTFDPVFRSDRPSAALLADGRILLLGGYRVTDAGSRTPRTSTDIFDPARKTMTAGPEFPEEIYGLRAARLADGRVLIIGRRGGTTVNESLWNSWFAVVESSP
jgi:hypothetical protein